MEFPEVNIEFKDHVAIVKINRPEALNALNKNVFDGLESFFTRHAHDVSVRGVIITGEGNKAFVAGADIKEFIHLGEKEGAALSRRGQQVFLLIEKFHAPVIAAVNGYALGGGCELAMACHLRVAGEKARFGQPEVNLGLVPGYGGSQRLIQNIGKTRAMYMLLTGEAITADVALEWGLVNKVVPAGEELEHALAMINVILGKGPIAISKTISLVNDYFDKKTDGFDREASDFGETLGSSDAKEGALAFIEKRKPNFTGK